MSRQAILQAVDAERNYQQNRWGDAADDTFNTPWMWVAYIASYSTRWMKGTFLPLDANQVDEFRAAMVKVAAIATAAVESIDRQRAEGGKTFYEA